MDAPGAREEVDELKRASVRASALKQHLHLWLADLLDVRGIQDVTVRTTSLIERVNGVTTITATAVGIGRDVTGDVVALAQASSDALPEGWGGTGKFLMRDMLMHGERMRCSRNERGLPEPPDANPWVVGVHCHGFVDRSRVRFMFMREDDQALALLRWAVS